MTSIMEDINDSALGGSEYLDYTNDEVKGGNIRYRQSYMLKVVVFAILLIIIIYLIYRIYVTLVWNGNEDYNQWRTRQHFENLHGEAFDEDAKNVIRFGENIENPRAMDHYRLGTVYLMNASDPHAAFNHYNRALQHIIRGDVNMREAPFIIDRIEEHRDRFIEFPEIEELPIQAAILAHFETVNNTVKQVAKQKQEVQKDDPEFTQKVLMSRSNWDSDSQNVHDSAIYKEFKNQFDMVVEENKKIKNGKYKNYHDLTHWLRLRFKNDPRKLEKVNKVLKFLDHNYPIGAMEGVREQDIIEAVWRRSFDQRNVEKHTDMHEALADAVLDCVEGKHVVCMSGRNTKIWQALAYVDCHPKMGIFKSKQALRNEIFEKAAKIVDDQIGSNGSASSDLIEDYNNCRNTQQVQELIDHMRNEIGNLKKEYEGRLPKHQLDLIIDECQQVV